MDKQKGAEKMYEQMDIFSYLEDDTKLAKQKISDYISFPRDNTKPVRLKPGDYIGRLVLGEIEKGRITEVVGNEEHFFYRTDKGCFSMTDRTDFDQMEQEAEEIRKRYKTIEIGKFDKFFAVMYPPRECDGVTLCAMVGIYENMLFWKEDVTYQFLEPVKNVEDAYNEKLYEITHEWYGERKQAQYEILDNPIKTNRLYWSNKGFYADARYVKDNG